MGDKGETAILFGQEQSVGGTIQTELERIDVVSEQENSEERSKWGALLIIVGIATTLGTAVPVGYNIGVINSPAESMRIWANETLWSQYNVSLSNAEIQMVWSGIVSIFLVGGAVGSLGGAWIAHRYGRKGSFLISGMLFFIGSVLFIFCRMAKSVEMLIAGRLIVGLASGLTTTTLPMYLTELAPLALRGTLGVFCAIGVTGGVVVGQVFTLDNVFGNADLWHFALGAYVLLVIVCFLPAYFFPESPKYLFIVQRDYNKARQELARLRSNDLDQVKKELDEMSVHAQHEVKSRSMCSVIRDPTLLLPLVIVCAFQGGQQLSGVNAVFYYSVSIFQEAGLSVKDAQWANLGAGCVNLITSLFGPPLMSKVNRRPLMLLSCAASAIFLFALTFVVHFIEYAYWMPVACIACVFCYIFFYQFGLGPIPYFIGSELFDVAPRPIAMSLGSLSNWACNFIIGMAFPSVQLAWGAFVFLPFSIVCVLLVVLTKLYLPETRGRDPADIAPLISKGFRSRAVQ